MRRIFVYETTARFYLIGANSERTEFRVLKIDRSDAVNLQIVEDSHIYNARQILEMQSMLKSTNSVFRRVCIGCGILGFVKFLQGYYLLIATKRVKVGAVPSNVYRIADTQMIYLPAQQQTSSEEQKLVKLFQNVDLRSNFYFSYDFDLSRSFQSNWLTCYTGISHNASDRSEADNMSANRDSSSKRAGLLVCDKFIWNWRMTEAFRERDEVSTEWLFYVIHGYFGQAVINAGRSLYLVVIARRSRHFAGTRYLKRGINWQGYVANEVEVEQAVIETSFGSLANCPPRTVSSYVQIRGSVPILWSHDTHQKVMAPKPTIQLDLVDPFYSVTAVHFDHLLTRFGAPLIVLNLLKRVRREAIIGDHFEEGVEYLNQFLPRSAQVRKVWVDLSRLKKLMRGAENASALEKLTQVCEALFLETDCFAVYAGNLENRQHGVVRSNCVDCLDRTNIAQFALGRVALGHQLHALRILDRPDDSELDESELLRVLELMYEECGNTLALQYGGSQLAHTVDAYRPLRKYSKPKIVTQSRDLMQTVSRFYSNTFSDAVKQASLNVFGGLINVERGLDACSCLPTAMTAANSISHPSITTAIGTVAGSAAESGIGGAANTNANTSVSKAQFQSQSQSQLMLLADETIEPDYYLHNDVPAGRCPISRYSYTQWYTPLILKYLPFAIGDTCTYYYQPASTNANCIERTFVDDDTGFKISSMSELSMSRNALLFDALYKPYRVSSIDKHIQRQLVEVPLYDAAMRNQLLILRARDGGRKGYTQAGYIKSVVETLLKLRIDLKDMIHVDDLIVDALLRRTSSNSKPGNNSSPKLPRLRKFGTSIIEIQSQSKPIWSKNIELNGTRIDLHIAYVTLAECSSQQHINLLRQYALSRTNLQSVNLLAGEEQSLSRFDQAVELANVSIANDSRLSLAANKHQLATRASRPNKDKKSCRDTKSIIDDYLNVDRLCGWNYAPSPADLDVYADYVTQTR